MSKYNRLEPAFHIAPSSHTITILTRQEIDARNNIHGEEIAAILGRGSYGMDGGLVVYGGTKWPGWLSEEPDALGKVFPFKRDAPWEMPFSVGERSAFLCEAAAVHEDLAATVGAIGAQYEKLRSEYVNAPPAKIADVRSIRREAEGALTRYCNLVDAELERIRRYAAVLYIEGRRAHTPDPATNLSQEQVGVIREVGNPFALDHFWRSALHGGPPQINDAGALADLLRTEGANEELLRVQSEAIFGVLTKRDEIIRAALPVEYRRAACELILWKVAHGRPVEKWGEEDSKALRSNAGSPKFRDAAISEDVQRLIINKYEELIQKDGYAADPAKGKVSEKMKIAIVRWLSKKKGIKVSEETVRNYLTKYLDKLDKKGE